MPTIALCGGGDWTDASVTCLNVDVDLKAAYARYRAWYNDEYVPQRSSRFMSFEMYLCEREGASPADVEIVHEEDL